MLTSHNQIMLARSPGLNRAGLQEDIRSLEEAVDMYDEATIACLLEKLVPQTASGKIPSSKVVPIEAAKKA